MSSPARFSVVIPSRNRAGLLRHALATVTTQRRDDLEILVSDNHSHDQTAALVSEVQAGDPRVRMVRPPEPLEVCDHWEWAVTQTRGQWVMVLGDDDGLVPGFFDHLEPHLEAGPRALAWRKAWYVHPDADPPWPRPDEVNHLILHGWTGRVEPVESRDELGRAFARRERDVRPAMNSLVRRDLVAELRERVGRAYGTPDPAYSFYLGVLALEPAYLAIDLPLAVMGICGASISTSFRHVLSDRHGTVDEYDTDDLITSAPMRARTSANLWAETVLRTQESLPDALGEFTLDRVAYYLDARSVLAPSDDGAFEEWSSALEAEPVSVRSAVQRELRRRRLRTAAREVARRVPPLRGIRSLLRARRGVRPFRVVSGDDAGFTDLPGAASWLARRELPSRQPGSGRQMARVTA